LSSGAASILPRPIVNPPVHDRHRSAGAPAPAPAHWRRGPERRLAATRVFDVHGVQFTHPVRGTEREFIVVHVRDWVNIVALTPEGEVVLVRQFRFGIETLSLEVPGGVIEAGEDPVAAGLRELREETGYVGERGRLIASIHPNPAIQDNRCHLVLVENVRRVAPTEWDADEEIEVVTLPLAEALACTRDGRITHALALNALHLAAPLWRGRDGAGATA
jgi:8-oxo-dGTP pyrophosphatase MutT (NUDIX family)